MREKQYKFGSSILTIKFDDITNSKDQVIVSSDDYYLSMGGGVSAAILRKGGNEIAIDASKKVPAKLGSVVITTAGRLPANFIFHCITIGRAKKDIDPKEIIASTTLKCLELMEALNLKSISFPSIGAGLAGFSYDDVAAVMSDIISKFMKETTLSFKVTLYLFDRTGNIKPEDFISFFESFVTKVPDIDEYEIDETEVHNETSHISKLVLNTETEIKSKRIHNLRIHLSRLEDQRFALEEAYISALNKDDIESTNRTKKKLHENEEYRLQLLKELEEIKQETKSRLNKITEFQSVFVSSTYKDLINHRKLIMQEISRTSIKYVGMEHFGADPHLLPAIKIREEVTKCDLYIGIFGTRYGYIDPATGMSMTEIEYREAVSCQLPCFIYLISSEASVPVSDIERNPTALEKFNSLKEELQTNHIVFMFKNKEELSKQIIDDLIKKIT